MEVYEPEALAHSLLVEQFQCVEQFGACESELGSVSSALLPFSGARRSEFDANANIGHHVEFLGHLGDDFQFVSFLYDDKDLLAHFLRQQGELYVALVFVSVADDDGVALALHGNDRMKFWFGAGLQSEVEFLSVGDDFLHHGLHLVHLDGVDHVVLSLVVVFLACFFEAAPCLFDAAVENVGESEQHRRCHIAQGQFVHHFSQVYLRGVLAGSHIDVSLFVDAEIGGAPPIDVVELLRVVNSPFFHCSLVVCGLMSWRMCSTVVLILS